jgi:flagellar motor switch protein FliM
MNAGAEVLDQEEIDALLKGVNSSEVQVEAGASVPGEVRPYDLATQMRSVRGRLPALELINDLFARSLRSGLYNMIRRNAEISVVPMQVFKYGDYQQTLRAPASLNLVKLPPLRGTALFVLDARLVFALVDNFFGGTGRLAKLEGRDFTGTETRIVQMVLRQAYASLQEAWAPVRPLQVESLNSETNPQFANIVSATEAVLVTAYKIELDGGGGELHVVMPNSMLEPIKELQGGGMQGERGGASESWTQALREELREVSVEVVPFLGQSVLTVGQLLNLKPGDVIPCDFDGHATLLADGLPLLRGTYGASRGQQAIKVQGQVQRRKGPRAGDATDSAA